MSISRIKKAACFRLINHVALCVAFAYICLPAQAQNVQFNGRTNYWDDVGGYIDAQNEHSLDVVTQLLSENSPSANLGTGRKAAFVLLDNIFHQVNPADSKPVQNYYHNRMASLLEYLKTNKATSGAYVYKLYNHGFIVCTANGTFAFDFTRGKSSKSNNFAISDSLAKALVGQCDVLFVSHWHPDHADDWVAQEFINQNKTVISPDSVWMDKPFYSKVLHPVRSVDSVYNIKLTSNKLIQFRALPGYQSNVLNNIYIVSTHNGLTFAHTGDQYNLTDFAWIDSVKNRFSVDVLFPNSWSLNIERLIKGFNPKLIVPSHENELGHTVDHREAYWLSMDKFKSINRKIVYMTWGEMFYVKQHP